MSLRPFVLTASLLAALAAAPTFVPAFAEDKAAAPSSGEKVALAIRFEKGSKLGFEQKMQMTQMMNMGGMEIPTEISMNQSWTEACESVDAKGVGEMRTKFVRVHGSFSNPMMGDFPFDSDAPAAAAADDGNPMAAMGAQITESMTALAKIELVSHVAKDGSTVDMKAAEGVSLPPGTDPVEMGRQMGALGKLPSEPVGVGDSWTNESTITAGMGLKLKNTMKFVVKAIDADAVVVSVEGSITKLDDDGETSDDPQAAMVRQMMASMKVTDSKVSGEGSYSRKDGRLLGMKSVMSFKMESEQEGGMTLDQTANVAIARLEKLPVAATQPTTPAAPGETAPATPAGPAK